jgi:hypothetical protein
MTDDLDRADRRLSPHDPPPKPWIKSRWYLVVTFSNGTEREVPFDTQHDAEWHATLLGHHAVWRVEREWVGPRQVVGPIRRTRVEVDEFDVRGRGSPGDANGQAG